MEQHYRKYNSKTMQGWTLSIVTMDPPEDIQKFLGFWQKGDHAEVGKIYGD